MTPDTQPPWDGYRRPSARRWDARGAPAPGPALGPAPGAGPSVPPGGPVSPAPPTSPAPAFPVPPPPVPAPPPVLPAPPAQAPPRAPAADNRRATADASIVGRGAVGYVPLLAVLVAVVAGVSLAWLQGSSGAGVGGVVAGAGLLAGAAGRLLLSPRAAGLLVNRKRATDVVTLAVLGIGLLVAGLVLPR